MYSLSSSLHYRYGTFFKHFIFQVCDITKYYSTLFSIEKNIGARKTACLTNQCLVYNKYVHNWRKFNHTGHRLNAICFSLCIMNGRTRWLYICRYSINNRALLMLFYEALKKKFVEIFFYVRIYENQHREGENKNTNFNKWSFYVWTCVIGCGNVRFIMICIYRVVHGRTSCI